MVAEQDRVERSNPSEEAGGCLSALVRAIWMLFGNIALLGAAVLVAKGSEPVVSDIALFAVALGLLCVRYVDITRFKGETTDGKPATSVHLRRYALLMMLVTTGLWALARLAASRGWA